LNIYQQANLFATKLSLNFEVWILVLALVVVLVLDQSAFSAAKKSPIVPQ